MTRVLFWDIDGTLLTTARAGIFAWEDAVRRITGRPADFASLETAGLTDAEIAFNMLNTNRARPAHGAVRSLLREYERRLPECLHRKVGHVLPGVRAVLEHLSERPDMLSLLLTGNTRAGAGAKLRHYGLDHHFWEGAFAEDGPDRSSIARVALGLAQAKLAEEVPLDRVYVIGDTPLDIRCGKDIGARTIAVATGVHSPAMLQEHSPWVVLERLPDPEGFEALLDLPPRPVVRPATSQGRDPIPHEDEAESSDRLPA